MAKCGTQVVLCDLPIRFDTYSGCSHGCRYCFTYRNLKTLDNIKVSETAQSLKNFIDGKRAVETNWCDWNIPLHWGGLSDPFQPIEKEKKISLECLKLLAETQYPFVVSTKGKLVIEPEYLDLLSKCNCVVQISMVCSKLDKLELGCPTYEERLEIVRILSKKVKRVNIRIQPYMTSCYKEVFENIKRLADAGAYGLIFEGMKFFKKKHGLVKLGGDHVFDKKTLQSHFEKFKEECHKQGLKFYSGENRLRTMGDDMCCCGIDGLDGFKGNSYNLCHMVNEMPTENTEKMEEVGTAHCFSSLYQNTAALNAIKKSSFKNQMLTELKNGKNHYLKVFGKD